MEEIVSNLIKKILIRKFGPIKYNTFYDKDTKRILVNYPYSYSNIDYEIIDETKMLLGALGLNNVGNLNLKHGFIIYGTVNTP